MRDRHFAHGPAFRQQHLAQALIDCQRIDMQLGLRRTPPAASTMAAAFTVGAQRLTGTPSARERDEIDAALVVAPLRPELESLVLLHSPLDLVLPRERPPAQQNEIGVDSLSGQAGRVVAGIASAATRAIADAGVTLTPARSCS